MTCRSGVVSVAIVVRTARTTASVLTPEPNTLRARTGWSGRVLYARCVCVLFAPLAGAGCGRARRAGAGPGVRRVWGVQRMVRGLAAQQNGARGASAVCWVHAAWWRALWWARDACLRPCSPSKRGARLSFAAERDRTPVHADRLSVCWAGVEDARGGVSSPSMGGVNPPALVLDRNHASG